MRKSAQTAGIALSVLLCLAGAGTAALFVMGAGSNLLMNVLSLQEESQIAGAVAMSWLFALIPVVAATTMIARAVAARGDSVMGIMLGVAAYPAMCVALVILAPRSWEELRWIGFEHGFVAVPVALGVAVTWALIRPRCRHAPDVGDTAKGPAVAPPHWRPVG